MTHCENQSKNAQIASKNEGLIGDSLHFQTKVIWFPPRFQDGANLDLTSVHQERKGPFVCSGTKRTTVRFQDFRVVSDMVFRDSRYGLSRIGCYITVGGGMLFVT